MLIIDSTAALRETIAGWRRAGERIVLVPTMGNLHAGHLNLVDVAYDHGARVVVSIFVNPLQFGANEDLDSYPRTPEEDAVALRERRVDLLFMPTAEQMYPNGQEGVTMVEVPGLSSILCGVSRPVHFRGVATVVSKLFNLVQPDAAVFGQKDYQQLCVIRRMVEDLCFPVEVIGAPTVREDSGLAMSSRNGYLNAEERGRAPTLYQTLEATAAALADGATDFSALEAEAASRLTEAGFVVDYFSIRRQGDLAPAGLDDRALAVLAAAFLGRTRLIDNILINK